MSFTGCVTDMIRTFHVANDYERRILSFCMSLERLSGPDGESLTRFDCMDEVQREYLDA